MNIEVSVCKELYLWLTHETAYRGIYIYIYIVVQSFVLLKVSLRRNQIYFLVAGSETTLILSII